MRNLSRFEDVSLAIGGSATGIYLAYPTSPELKPTYRGHRTLVNDLHTKIGVASKSFVSRENEYMSTFNFEVAFFPILEVSVPRLHVLESRVIAAWAHPCEVHRSSSGIAY